MQITAPHRPTSPDELGETLWSAVIGRYNLSDTVLADIARQSVERAAFLASDDGKDFIAALGERVVEEEMIGTQKAKPLRNVLEQEAVLLKLGARLAGINSRIVGADKAPRHASGASPTPRGLKKREQQIAAILNAIKGHGWPAQRVPTGKKSALRKELKATMPDLFGAGDSPFDDAWKEASCEGRLRIEGYTRYLQGR